MKFLSLVLGPPPSVLALLIVPAILAKTLPAQTHTPQSTKSAQQQKAAATPGPEAIAARPPASPAPNLPADQPPSQAKVSLDSRGLEIDASNSSLNEILNQVAADTGARLEGLAQDQRVFGSYGPGPGSDVLWKLLDGSGYNVLMVGGGDADAPLEIVLSARSVASPPAATGNLNDRNSELAPEPRRDDPSEPAHPEPAQNPFANGEPPRDPMQFMQEILQRQQQIDQQQQQKQSQQDSRNSP